MITLRHILQTAQNTLAENKNDAAILLAHVLDVSRLQLITLRNQTITTGQFNRFQLMINQRKKYKPVAQIIARREFWRHNFKVTGDVLDPRADTETLIEQALTKKAADKILDLGTGSGCILLTLLAEWQQASGLGVDILPLALQVAQENATALKLNNRVNFQYSNWFSQVYDTFDLIICNPPYISAAEMSTLQKDIYNWEPHIALYGGIDGLDVYRLLAPAGRRFLNKNGRMILECGDGQAAKIQAIFTRCGWKNPTIYPDINGKNRVIVLTA